jgi:hypothetical protein
MDAVATDYGDPIGDCYPVEACDAGVPDVKRAGKAR